MKGKLFVFSIGCVAGIVLTCVGLVATWAIITEYYKFKSSPVVVGRVTEIAQDCELEQADSWIGGEWINPTYRIITDTIRSANSWYFEPGLYDFSLAWTDTPTNIKLTRAISNTDYDLVYKCKTNVATAESNSGCVLKVSVAGHYALYVERESIYPEATILDSVCVKFSKMQPIEGW